LFLKQNNLSSENSIFLSYKFVDIKIIQEWAGQSPALPLWLGWVYTNALGKAHPVVIL
jgi:hypothetical protein